MNSTFLLSLKIFLSWILLLLIFYLIGGIIFGGASSINLYSLANWDGRHFLEIAQYGYRNNIQYAFFPLYPLLINGFTVLTGLPFFLSALLINLTSSFLLIFVFLVFLKETAYKNHIKILTLFLIFPTSFYLISVYSESLFLLFALSCFYFIRKKNLLAAAIFASLSASLRIAGLALIAALLVEIFISTNSLRRKTLLALVLISGFLSYCFYLFISTGNPFYFLISEQTWGRGITIPGENIIYMVSFLAAYGLKPESFTLLSDLIFTIFGLGIGIKAVKNLKLSESTYTISALIIPLVTSLLLSIPRFLLVVFPLFILVSEIKNRVFRVSYLIICLTLLFLYFNFFIRNIWVS